MTRIDIPETPLYLEQDDSGNGFWSHYLSFNQPEKGEVTCSEPSVSTTDLEPHLQVTVDFWHAEIVASWNGYLAMANAFLASGRLFAELSPVTEAFLTAWRDAIVAEAECVRDA